MRRFLDALYTAAGALAAARALMEYEVDAETLARKAMKVAGDICVYTNDQLTVEVLESSS